MTKIWEGKPVGVGLRFGIVLGRFNNMVTDKLLEGALEALRRARVGEADVEVVRVPGAFEIPLAAKRLAETGRFAAVICLGAIVKGDTPHWHYLSKTATSGICQASLATNVPMTNAVLTTDTMEQAVERARQGSENKNNRGYDAALAAVEMAFLFEKLEDE